VSHKQDEAFKETFFEGDGSWPECAKCGHFKQEHTWPPFLGCDCGKCDCFEYKKEDLKYS